MDDLTRALARRIHTYRRLSDINRAATQQLFTANNKKITELAGALGYRGVNREAAWDMLITSVTGLMFRYREARHQLKDRDPARRIDTGALTDIDIAHLIEQGWTPPPGTRTVYCKKGPYDCWAPAGHDGECLPTY